ncbi:uncharacterized protein LOC143425708 [Xylocopa sonorina]|uniref:uncharacterized protein LOC143425708 n=1 Tax=Xylocopa sonorina TaxID=1818115 RepID=UPI00403AAD2E
MLLFLLYLISISRVTIVYISNNLINKVKTRKGQSQAIESKSDDKVDEKAEQDNVPEVHSNHASTVDPKHVARPQMAKFEKLNAILGDGPSSPKVRRKDSIRKKVDLIKLIHVAKLLKLPVVLSIAGSSDILLVLSTATVSH